jgi:hypothetical protein
MSRDLDHETQAAIEALVYRLRNRTDEDDEPFAQEYVLAMRLRGWRPTEARVVPGWRHPAAPRTEPTEEWRQARAELEQKLHRPEGDAA